MKKSVKLCIVLIALSIAIACTPQSQPQPQAVTQSITAPTPDLNTELLNFASQNPDLIKHNILITCKTAFPELNISDVETGSITGYVVDQNPMTLNYQPKVEISLSDTYFVNIYDGLYTIKDKNHEIVSDQNIINLVTSAAASITKGRSHFTASVTLEKINGAILTKSATCQVK